MDFTDPTILVALLEDEETKIQINDAFTKAAEALGIGADRRDEVIDLIATLADELCHVEALREQLERVFSMRKKVDQMAKLYSSDRTIGDIADPISQLMRIAVKKLSLPIDQVDGQTGEVLAVLKNIAPQVQFVRNMRDDLYCRLRVWDKMFERWERMAVSKMPSNEDLVRDTYRFLAPRFMRL